MRSYEQLVKMEKAKFEKICKYVLSDLTAVYLTARLIRVSRYHRSNCRVFFNVCPDKNLTDGS